MITQKKTIPFLAILMLAFTLAGCTGLVVNKIQSVIHSELQLTDTQFAHLQKLSEVIVPAFSDAYIAYIKNRRTWRRMLADQDDIAPEKLIEISDSFLSIYRSHELNIVEHLVLFYNSLSLTQRMKIKTIVSRYSHPHDQDEKLYFSCPSHDTPTCVSQFLSRAQNIIQGELSFNSSQKKDFVNLLDTLKPIMIETRNTSFSSFCASHAMLASEKNISTKDILSLIRPSLSLYAQHKHNVTRQFASFYNQLSQEQRKKFKSIVAEKRLKTETKTYTSPEDLC